MSDEPTRSLVVPGALPRYQKRRPQAMSVLPEHLRGDGPCNTCGTEDNIVWFTQNVFWNTVVLTPGAMDKILCIPCFVELADAKGFHITGWQLTPEWHWETKAEAAERRSMGDSKP